MRGQQHRLYLLQKVVDKVCASLPSHLRTFVWNQTLVSNGIVRNGVRRESTASLLLNHPQGPFLMGHNKSKWTEIFGPDPSQKGSRRTQYKLPIEVDSRPPVEDCVWRNRHKQMQGTPSEREGGV